MINSSYGMLTSISNHSLPHFSRPPPFFFRLKAGNAVTFSLIISNFHVALKLAQKEGVGE